MDQLAQRFTPQVVLCLRSQPGASAASVPCLQLPFIRTVISLRKGKVKIESRWSIHDGPSTAYDAQAMPTSKDFG